MRRTVALLVGLGLCVASDAAAHDADLIFVEARPGEGHQVDELATMTQTTLTILAPVDRDGDGVVSDAELAAGAEAIAAGVWEAMPLFAGAQRCAVGETSAIPREGYLELHARFACADGALRQEFRVLGLLPSNFKVVLAVGTDGAQRFAEGTARTLFLTGEPDGARATKSFFGWVLFGAEHIFQGYDHLAFLAALLLAATGWRRLLWMVTAFTLAHSITLAATALGLIPLGPAAARWIEVAIAASVLFVAVENVLGVREKHRPWVTFGFGLIHGFGFASVLRSYGLGESAAAALAGFNIGVELGQATIVAALFPLVLLLKRRRPELGRRLVLGASAAIALIGAYWLVTRPLA